MEDLVKTIVDALEEKKGEDILVLDLRGITSLTDYFVLCTGTSDRMIDALADGVLDKTRETLKKKGRKEGGASNGWLVVDYGYVMVHLFAPEERDFYNLEGLWHEAKVLLRLQ